MKRKLADMEAEAANLKEQQVGGCSSQLVTINPSMQTA